jgi:O-antigen/teichoic acid export membrane protein
MAPSRRPAVRHRMKSLSFLRTRLATSHQLQAVGGTTLALFAAQVMMAVAGVLAARELGPAGRGIVAAVLSWPIILAYLSLVGLNTAASIRVAGGQRDALGTTLGSAVVHSVVVGGVVMLGAIVVIPPALGHLGGNAPELAVWALATIPTIILADILMSINVALGRLAVANWCRVIGPLLLLAGTGMLVLRHAVAPGPIVALTIASGIVSLVVGAIGLPWRRLVVSLRELFRDLRFGAKAHLGSLIGMANVRLDLVLMSVFVAASQVGYYGVANNVMMPVTTLGTAAAVLLTPRVAKMADRDRRAEINESQFASIRKDGRRYLLASAVGAGMLAVVAPFAVPILFGSAFQPVVVLVWVLIPGYIARTYAGLMSAGTLGARRTWVGNVTEGAGFAVTAALLPLLLPSYGALGAAITSTASYSTSALVAMLAIRRLARQIRPSSQPIPGDHDELAISKPATVAAGRGG